MKDAQNHRWGHTVDGYLFHVLRRLFNWDSESDGHDHGPILIGPEFDFQPAAGKLKDRVVEMLRDLGADQAVCDIETALEAVSWTGRANNDRRTFQTIRFQAVGHRSQRRSRGVGLEFLAFVCI